MKKRSFENQPLETFGGRHPPQKNFVFACCWSGLSNPSELVFTERIESKEMKVKLNVDNTNSLIFQVSTTMSQSTHYGSSQDQSLSGKDTALRVLLYTS